MPETLRTAAVHGVRHGTANAFKDLDEQAAREVFARVLTRCDVVGFQEVETSGHRAALRDAAREHGFRIQWFADVGFRHRASADAVPIAWRRDRFQFIRAGRRLIHRGQRAVTPDRWLVWVVLRDLVSGQLVVRANTHLISQAFTSHPERFARWRTGAGILRRQSRRLAKKYGAMVGGGDLNRSHWAPDGTTGLWASRGTHGARTYYDALWIRGACGVDGPVRRITTPSDHDALVATIVPRSAA